jgi:uncharacterized repeat protein (TIGR02543 family)
MNQPFDTHFKRFAAIFSILLAATAASFGATAALTVQVTPNGSGTVSPNYNGQQLLIGKTYSIEAHDKADFTFTGWTGSQSSSKSKLTFVMAPGLTFTANFADEKKPTLTVAKPPDSKKLTSDTIIVTGTARDNAAVANVFYSLNGTGWQQAMTSNGYSNWWASVTLNANTNTLEAYAVDTSGNQSKIAKVKMTLIAVPPSLAGMTMMATPDGVTTNTKSFSTTTFSEDTAVGTYTFKKASVATAKLSLKYTAPPTAAHSSNDVTVLLQFTDTTNGTFTDSDGVNNFTLAPAEDWAPPTLAGASVILLSDGGNETDLTFPAESVIVDNGHMFNVANPLAISLATPYAGEIGDRVSVPFIQLKNFSGQFEQVGTPIFAGTVIDINTNTNANAVTILFDKPTFVSKTELFAPVSGSLVNILTFDYTNSDTTTGTGTSTFTNYSAVGSLLQLNQSNENNFLVLTFTNDSDAGSYYEESFNTASNTPSVDAGSFSLTLPPQITAQPTDVTTTNGGTASFTVTATGSSTLAYQWQMNGTNLTDGTTDWGSMISGSLTTNLVISTVATNDEGNYQVVITNNFGSVTSSIVTLTIGDN